MLVNRLNSKLSKMSTILFINQSAAQHFFFFLHLIDLTIYSGELNFSARSKKNGLINKDFFIIMGLNTSTIVPKMLKLCPGSDAAAVTLHSFGFLSEIDLIIPR